MTLPFRLVLTAFLTLLASTVLPVTDAAAQNPVTFGAVKADPNAPVEVTADQLAVNQNDNTAVFTGNVVIVQGAMRLGADTVRVEYAKGDTRKIEKLIATGSVVLTSGTDTAGADKAVYTVATSTVDMTGNVLLTQAGSTIAGQAMTVDLKTGTGQMSGRVKTVLQPSTGAPAGGNGGNAAP